MPRPRLPGHQPQFKGVILTLTERESPFRSVRLLVATLAQEREIVHDGDDEYRDDGDDRDLLRSGHRLGLEVFERRLVIPVVARTLLAPGRSSGRRRRF